tara:strand:+ start:37 stop:531 length:495 start_codon:yes stop_codon:yes gene_type:complete
MTLIEEFRAQFADAEIGSPRARHEVWLVLWVLPDGKIYQVVDHEVVEPLPTMQQMRRKITAVLQDEHSMLEVTVADVFVYLTGSLRMYYFVSDEGVVKIGFNFIKISCDQQETLTTLLRRGRQKFGRVQMSSYDIRDGAQWKDDDVRSISEIPALVEFSCPKYS